MITSLAHRLPRRRVVGFAVAVVVAVVAAVLTGCGGSDDNGVAQADGSSAAAGTTSTATLVPADREAALLAFSQCMRTDGGIPDYPDPQTDGEGELQLPRPERDVDPDAVQAGIQECRGLLDGVINTSPEAQADIRDAQLAFARCLRVEGVDVPDPDPNQVGPGAFGNLNREDPDVLAAFENCGPAFQEALRAAQGGS